MGLIDNPLSGLLERVLAHHTRRHSALASNIANASTPGYRAFDVVLRERLTGDAPSPRDSRRVESDAAPRLDGNNVSLEEQFVKLAENRTMYQAAFELYDKWGGLSRLARETR